MTTQPQTVSSIPKGFSGGRMAASAAAVVAMACLVVAGWSLAISGKGVSAPAPAPAPAALTRPAIDDAIITAPVLSGTPGDSPQALRLEHRIFVAGSAKSKVSGTDGDSRESLRLEHLHGK